MSRLFLSEIGRMTKSAIFWICAAAVLAASLFIMKMGSVAVQNGRAVTLEEYFFYLGPVIPLFFSVFISMFMGTEHSDGTVRNKLIVGYSRKQIYLAYYLAGLTGTGILTALWFLGGLTGIPVLGSWTMDLSEIMTYIIITILYCALLTAVFSFFSIMISNKAVSAVVQIIAALLLILLGSMLYNQLCEPELIRGMILENGEIVMSEPEPNPAYIGGTMRQIYIFLVNILPTGQGILMLHRESWGDVPMIVPLQICSSVCLALFTTAAGILIFRRKDMK